MSDRRYLQRDDLAAALGEAVAGDVLPQPRPATIRYDGQPWSGHVHARRYDPTRGGWLGLVTYDREVTDGWWHAVARWVPARQITVDS